MALKGTLLKIHLLSTVDKQDMFQLMECYYENIKYENFEADLMEKDTVLLLKDEKSVIQGFTTIKLFDLHIDNTPVRIVFSGDTIINQEYWGELELHRTWIRAVYEQIGDWKGKIFWLLISKGYKTYRFLPVYFKSYFPCFKKDIPAFEKSVIDTFCEMKFSDKYNPLTGVVHMNGEKDYLKAGVADLSEQRLKDPHIHYFMTKNPGHVYGDELVCLTELVHENMKSMVLRYLRGA